MESGNRLNVDRLMKVLSEILSEKYGCKITMTAIPKEQYYRELEEAEKAKKAEQLEQSEKHEQKAS